MSAKNRLEQKRKKEELLEELDVLLIQDLIKGLKEGTLTPSEKAAAVRLLKNNEINCAYSEGEVPDYLKEDPTEDDLPFSIVPKTGTQ